MNANGNEAYDEKDQRALHVGDEMNGVLSKRVLDEKSDGCDEIECDVCMLLLLRLKFGSWIAS